MRASASSAGKRSYPREHRTTPHGADRRAKLWSASMSVKRHRVTHRRELCTGVPQLPKARLQAAPAFRAAHLRHGEGDRSAARQVETDARDCGSQCGHALRAGIERHRVCKLQQPHCERRLRAHDSDNIFQRTCSSARSLRMTLKTSVALSNASGERKPSRRRSFVAAREFGQRRAALQMRNKGFGRCHGVLRTTRSRHRRCWSRAASGTGAPAPPASRHGPR